jgi:hypothetical protein
LGEELILSRFKSECTLCGCDALTQLTDFPDTPIANQLFSFDSLPAKGQDFFPLNLTMCGECQHIQLDTLIDPDVLFHDYPYVSNSSLAMSDRLDKLAASIMGEIDLHAGSFVLEIGSNDGYLLSRFKLSGMSVLGVDPAVQATDIALENDIPTIVEFFSTKVASEILSKYGKPNLIVANNVLAHTDNLQDIFGGITSLMSESTITIIEFSYVLDVYEKLLFDTIYHEHTSYHSIKPLVGFLRSFGLEIFRVERFEAHGGSARIYIQKIGSKFPTHESVGQSLNIENDIGIHEVSSWEIFNKRVVDLGYSISSKLLEYREQGGLILGYGVPAKFTTLFHVLGLKESFFDFIVDDNPLKVGKFAPGTNIEIKHSDSIPNVDWAFVFSWNYSEPIVEKLSSQKRVKCAILVPLPNFHEFKLI